MSKNGKRPAVSYSDVAGGMRSEQGHLVGIVLGRCGGTQQAVDGGDGGDLTRLARRFLGEAQGAANGFEGVAHVLEFAVELVAVAIEEVLQALEQVGREVPRVTRRVAVGADRVEPGQDERAIPLGRAEQAPVVESVGGPAQGGEQAAPIALEHGRRPVGVEAQTQLRE
jgi:hypothetical protein